MRNASHLNSSTDLQLTGHAYAAYSSSGTRHVPNSPSVGTCTQYVPNAGSSLDTPPTPINIALTLGSPCPELRPPDHRFSSVLSSSQKSEPMVARRFRMPGPPRMLRLSDGIRDAREKHSNQHTRIIISENPFQGSRLK
eukprot:3966948-Prymnesium_polylepis.1